MGERCPLRPLPARRERVCGPDRGLGDACGVVVLNDDHNTFDGVAFALAAVIPGVDYDRGMAFANRSIRPAAPSSGAVTASRPSSTGSSSRATA